VGKYFPDLALKREVRTVESFGPGNYCYVKLDYERASVVISAVGTYNKSRKAVANEVVRQVGEFLKSGKACEKHLADQLLVPLHLLVGGHTERETEGFWEDEVWHPNWDVAVQKETLHYKTNKDVIAQFAESIRP
jgi:RNA 3'-terminal phosphate cyclase